MMNRCTAIAAALVAATVVSLTTGAVRAADDDKYPDWMGQWRARFLPVGTQPSHDQTKPYGFGQQAPLTPEYAAVLAASMADQAQGGIGNYPTTTGRPAGMPNMMMGFGPMEWVITPDTTYLLIGWHDHYRRIFTDGRDWPERIEPSFSGYSIGRWLDEDGDGHYDVLEVETRGPFKGPRAFDEAGLPLAFDNQSIFKERIWRDKADPKFLHDEITTFDHALTRPWTVDKVYIDNPEPRPDWPEFYIMENNDHKIIGKEHYFLSGDGMLMPTRKNQPLPDLRYFTHKSAKPSPN